MESNFKEELNIKLAERDSIHEVKDSMLTVYYSLKVDSSYAKSISASNEALAKYNLVLIDSMNKVTSKINLKTINLPQISLEANSSAGSPLYISQLNNEDYLNIKFVSSNNTSYNIRIDYCIINSKEISNNQFLYKVIECGKIYDNRKVFLSGRFSTTQIKVNSSWKLIENPIIIFSGEFSSDEENKNKRNYFQAYEFDFKNQSPGRELIGQTLDELKNYLKEKKFIR